MSERFYKFTWDAIGDIETERPHLGTGVPLEIYRMFQHTLCDVLEETVGTEEADLILYKAGHVGGKHFYERYLAPCSSLNELLNKTEKVLADKKMSIMHVEEADEETLCVTLAVSEDIDGSGLPEMSQGVCNYDEGFIAGLLEAFSGKPFYAKGIDCWCTEDRVCRFEVRPR